MKVQTVVKNVSEPAKVCAIEDDYREYQKICGGCFSGYSAYSFLPFPLLRNVMLLCNDTGKLDGLPYNCHIGSEPLVGNVVFVAYGNHGETIDLTDEQQVLLLGALLL